MRKISILLFATILFTSCVVKYPFITYSNVIDFTPYTDSGFFLTESNSVSFDYSPVGSLSTTVKSGYEVLNVSKKVSRDAVYNDYTRIKYGKYISANVDDAITLLIESAKELGANGIINLNIVHTPDVINGYGHVVSPSSYIISGMAIKRN